MATLRGMRAEASDMMEKIGIEKTKTIAQHAGVKPGKVKGVDIVQFTKGSNKALEIISWEDFERILKERKLAVYEHGGFMKIMRA